MMASPLWIRHPKPDEFPAILEVLDREFVYGKNRSISLAKRYPHILCSEHADHLLLAAGRTGVSGVLAIRRFQWAARHHCWTGAMIGMVWVDPPARRSGIGSRLMSAAAKMLSEAGVSFGVLWTGCPVFYQRLGWIMNDRGLIGEAPPCSPAPSPATIVPQPLARVDAAWLESVRSRFLSMRVVRTANDYAAIPMPATEVHCFSARSGQLEGVALVGEAEGTGYVYEVLAHPSLWETIWQAIRARFVKVIVNGRRGDPFSQWLGNNRFVRWQPQQKAMWMRFSPGISAGQMKNWHIPYYDWI